MPRQRPLCLFAFVFTHRSNVDIAAVTVMTDRLAEDLASLRIERKAPAPAPAAGPPTRWARLVLAVLILGAIGTALYFATPAMRARVFKTEVTATEIVLVSPAQASIELSSTGYVVPQTVAK